MPELKVRSSKRQTYRGRGKACSYRNLIKSTYKSTYRSGGQSMVEFAFAIPFLLLIVLTIMYFGRVFYTKQAVAMACQEAARLASRTPELSDAQVRESLTGFSTSGDAVNANSVVAQQLGSAKLLSQGTTGSLPPGAKVKVLPFDSDGSIEDQVAPGTVGVRIEYPFVFVGNAFSTSASEFGNSVGVYSGAGGSPVSFLNFPISERAVSLTEVYQQ